jgi:hypothetical protein
MMTLFKELANFNEFFMVNLQPVWSPLSFIKIYYFPDFLDFAKTKGQVARFNYILIYFWSN